MEVFAGAGAWTSFDHAPATSNPDCLDDSFANNSQQQPPQQQSQIQSSALQDAEWTGFLRSIDQEESSVAGSELEAFHEFVPVTQATSAPNTTMAGLPMSKSSSSSSAMTSSSQQPTTQPEMIWPVTSASFTTSAPFHFFQSQQWRGEDGCHQTYESSLNQEGLCIDIPRPPQYGSINQGASFGHLVHQPSPHGQFRQDNEQCSPLSDQHLSFSDDAFGNEGDDEADAADPCYAKLLHRCLKETPEHTMSLKGLYEWVAHHSQKAKDPENRGWQNSVRHNLSMNAAFERVQPNASQGTKKGSLWRLTEQALKGGVISTTRYRKDPKRRAERRGMPAIKRQQSGARGGQATRASVRRQRDMLPFPRSAPYGSAFDHRQHHLHGHHAGYISPMSATASPQPDMFTLPASPSPYFFGVDQDCGVPHLPSNPHTPPQLQLVYGGATVKPAIHDFEFLHTGCHTNGLFGDDDDKILQPDTPSWATEASETSFFTNGPLSPNNMSREATAFSA